MQKVADIMSTNVRMMRLDAYVSEIAGVFDTYNISGAPVVDDVGTIVGFVSKTDVVHFDATGDDPTYATLREIASPNVVRIGSDESVERAAQKMLQENIHHLVVEDNDKVVGMLSSYDFVRLAASAHYLADRAGQYRPDMLKAKSQKKSGLKDTNNVGRQNV